MACSILRAVVALEKGQTVTDTSKELADANRSLRGLLEACAAMGFTPAHPKVKAAEARVRAAIKAHFAKKAE